MAVVDSSYKSAPQNHQSEQFRAEFLAIADWWSTYAQDRENGGFWGRIDHNNIPDRRADKSVVLNTRILWFFSELAILTREPRHAEMAHRAFAFVHERFVDREHGGVFWMLSATGGVTDARKQTYAQAFAIYACAAYHQFSGDPRALELALTCFDMLERRALDTANNGYFEAYARDWGPLDDVRLSEKEDNSPKTMNTHLHVLEAYTGLCKALPNAHARYADAFEALGNILSVYCEKFVDMESGHLRMFMSESWQDRSRAYSFGHDIESSWLIQKAITVLVSRDPSCLRFGAQVKRLAQVALRDGLRTTGGMADEYDIASGHFCDSAWWVQAEAMVGFASMWAAGEGQSYLDAALGIWRHVQQFYQDRRNGEWFWYSCRDRRPEETAYKVGPWKAPYHNGRAMMLMYQLLS